MPDDKTFTVNNKTKTTPIINSFTGAVFSTAYLPPVSWFIALHRSEAVFLEAFENYNKQSYRNRAIIATANGIEQISIPIASEGGKKAKIKEIKISQHGNWQQNHWRAIRSAYNSSPFFEYYEDDFAPFYEKRWNFLWDYNLDLLTLILNLLDLDKRIQLTDNYVVDFENRVDFREIIHPKKESAFEVLPYYQVFREKLGFIPDLSVVDLLFNMGNEAVFTLMKPIGTLPFTLSLMNPIKK